MSFYAGKPGLDVTLGKMRGVLRPGAGIDISAGTISTTGEAGVPYVGGTGIYIHGATVEADLDPGYRMEINGSTIGQLRYMPIETVTGSSVTMQAGHAYKIYATSAAVTLNTETIPADSFGLEGHLEIYVAGTGYVITGTNVVLANALEPDSVNNLTARFHDGLCILSVEDHVAGYIVTVNAASGAGSLAYGLSTSTNEYIAVDASLNGQTLDLAGVTTYAGEKHIVGNGPEETIISGSINCTSKTTVANLSLQDVTITGGTMTLGDAYIPSGSTVAVSGGALAVEKVSGNGGTIDLGGTNVRTIGSGKTAIFDGVIISSGLNSGTNATGGVFTASGTVIASSCTFANCSATYGGSVATITTGARVTLNNCIASSNSTGYGTIFAKGGELAISGGTYTGNIVTNGGGCAVITNGTVSVTDAVISGNKATVGTTSNTNDFRMNNAGGNLYLEGGCTVGLIYGVAGTVTFRGSNNVTSVYGGASVVISSDAILGLTGNTNPTPINPGGGISVVGGCTVINSAGASVSIAGGTYTQINNDGTTE